MADYPITAVPRRVVYSGSAGTGPYSFSFPVIAQTDIDVYLNTTKLTLTTNYTVAITASNGTGVVTLGVAAGSSDFITIVGARAIQRTTDFVTAGDLLASSLNVELDSQTIFVQQASEDADRAIKAPVTDPTSIDMTLPVKATRATKALGFDSAGDPVVSTLTLAQIEAGPTDAAASATAAANSATASASSATASGNSATASANSATASAASAATAETHAGTQSVDLFNGTGSQTAFTLTATPSSENNTSVYISGVYQQKNTYSVSGTTLTFSTAPPSGTGNVEVMHISTQSFGVDPSIGSVTTGAAGSSAAVSITSGGVLSFTIPQGDDGATGSTGSTGATGSAATVTVGSTTTGAAGSSAAVTNVGSSSAATLNFAIPKGDTGTTGTAATIAVGTVTTGAAGSSATIVNGGSSSAATFNFAIPRGDTGATGSTGTTGTAATIAAGTATGLTVGAAPTVTNSGSSSAATFNFGIPVGATGATGSAATIAVGSTTTGAAGSSASVANSGSSSAATFDFAIPKGDTGTTGTAATIAAGSATGLAAGASPTVTNSGSSSAATFNFGIPAGATGNTGNTGSTGAAATIAAGTATGLAAGASPTVTNSGSSSAATFNFGIPAGATGATGNTGSTGTAATIAVGSVTTGAAGSSATVTNVGSSGAATFNFAIPQGAAGTGSGDVTGPSSATDNAIARFDATTGKLLQNSAVTVSDAGAVAAGSLTLTTDLAIADGGTGSSTPGAARSALGVDAAGTDNSTNVTLAGSLDYLTLSGQEITRGAIVLSTDVSGTLPVANGGSGATSLTDGGILLGSGTGAITAMAVLANGEMIVGDGTTDPVAESGATLRTSIGVDAAGTDNSTNVTLAGSLDYLTIVGQEITRGAIVLTTDVSGTLPIANGGTNSTSAGAALTALGAAASGANSDITSLTGLTTDLTVAQGGTGAGTFAANGILYGNGTGAVAATAVGTATHVLTSNGSGVAPTFQAAGGGGATDIDGLSDGLTHSSGATVGLGTGALAADNGGANNNTALGYNALNDVVSTAANTAVGHSAGAAFTAIGGTFIGADAGVGGGGNNFTTALGYGTLSGPVTGGYNTVVGALAMSGASTNFAHSNVCAGMYAGTQLTTGTYNTFIGSDTTNGNICTTGSNNTTLGKAAYPSSATVSNEITLGNTAITKFRIPGINFVIKDTTATDNYVLTVDSSGEAGWEAGGATNINGLSDGKTNSGGTFTALGYQAANSYTGGTTGAPGVALGYRALMSYPHTASTGRNVAIGHQAARLSTSSEYGTFVGTDAGHTVVAGYFQTYIGADAGYNSEGQYNVFVGGGAGYGNANTGGTDRYQVGIGTQSLYTHATGSSGNTAVGHASFRSLTTGVDCVAIGHKAGYGNTTSTNTIIIGTDAASSTTTVSNEITLGNSSIATLRCQVTSITALSDRRDKKDIVPLELGLDFINSLNPVKFTWHTRDGAKVGQQEAGFIAQELDEAQIAAGAESYLDIVLKENMDRLEAAPGKLIPVLVKAIQDLSAEVATLKEQING